MLQNLSQSRLDSTIDLTCSVMPEGPPAAPRQAHFKFFKNTVLLSKRNSWLVSEKILLTMVRVEWRDVVWRPSKHGTSPHCQVPALLPLLPSQRQFAQMDGGLGALGGSAQRSMVVSDCFSASVLMLQSPPGASSTFREQKKKPQALSETVEPFLKLSLGQQPPRAGRNKSDRGLNKKRFHAGVRRVTSPPASGTLSKPP